MSVRTHEIESLDEFDQTAIGATSLAGWFIQSVDLRERSAILTSVEVTGAAFLGCTFAPGVEATLAARGALIFPKLPDLPFNPYRGGLYSVAELFGYEGQTLLDGVSYAQCHDALIYAWAKQATQHHYLADSLAISLHDHAITDALDEATQHLRSSQVVGVMGGHALRRGEPAFRAAMELGAALTRQGFTVLTGGGPGAMEAANAGAYLSGHDPDGTAGVLDQAHSLLAAEPSFHPSIDGWARAALTVRERWPESAAGHSIGIPTWFYGHEPPNAFATEIAKYFTNALREDTLLARCRGGIIYLGGAAGTVQEIFQAVTENYYATEDSRVAPLVLVGSAHWSEHLPAWQLLQALGRDRLMGQRIHLVEHIAEAVEVVVAHST